MINRFDYAKYYYWRVEFIEPQTPDDERYVMLYGDEGEIAGPMTMALAEAWVDRFDNFAWKPADHAGLRSEHRATG